MIRIDNIKPNAKYRFKAKVRNYNGSYSSIYYAENNSYTAGNLNTYFNTDYEVNCILSTRVDQSRITLHFYNTRDTMNAEIDVYDIVLAEGEEDLSYAKNTKTFYLDEPLRKINDVADRLYYDYSKGKYCVERKICRLLLNGSESWRVSNKDWGEGLDRYLLSSLYIPNQIKLFGTYVRGNLITKGFPTCDSGNSKNFKNIHSTNANLYLVVDNTVVTPYAANSIKDWLNNNNMEVFYELNNPFVEELEYTDKDINVYAPLTYVCTNSVVKPSILTIESRPVIFDVKLSANSEYTIQFDVNNVFSDKSLTYDLGGTIGEISCEKGYSTKKIVVTTPRLITENKLKFIGEGHTIKNVMLIKDGQTQQLSYFDGAVSLGELQENGKYKVDIRSYNKDDEEYNGVIAIENTVGNEIFEIEEIVGNTYRNINDLQDMVSVGELQEDGSYKIDIESVGENLFNTSSESVVNSPKGTYNNTQQVEFTGNDGEMVLVASDAGQATEFDVEFKAGVTYTISFDVITGSNGFFGTIAFCKKGATWEEIGSVRQNILPAWSTEYQHFTKTFTPDSDCVLYLGGGQWTFRGGTRTTLKNIMITIGDSEREYVPYSKNVTSIILPQPLCKVGDYADRLYWDNGKGHYCIEKNIFVELHDGSTSSWYGINWGTTYPFYGARRYGSWDAVPYFTLSTSGEIVGTNGNYQLFSTVGGKITHCNSYYNPNNGVVFTFKTTDINNDLDAFVSELQANPIYIYHKYKTPQIVDLPHLNEKITINAQPNKTYINVSNLNTNIKAVVKYGINLTFLLDDQLRKVGSFSDKLYWDEEKKHFMLVKNISPELQMLPEQQTIELTDYNTPIRLYPKEITKIGCNNGIKPSKIMVEYNDMY